MIDFDFRNKLLKEIPELKLCFQCGTCVSSCPAEKYIGSYSPRKKILSALYGQKEVLAEELYKCLTCNTCNERCPQDVNPYEVLVKLKNIALREGLVDAAHFTSANNVLETGLAFPVSELTEKQREELKLPKLKKNDVLKKITDLKNDREKI